MANRDMNARRKPLIAFAPATITTSVNGITVNSQGFDGVGFDVFVNGSVGDTLAVGSKSLEFNLQESADGSTWNYVDDQEIDVPYTQSSSGRGIKSTTTNAGGAANAGAFFMAILSSQLATGTVLRVSYVGSKQYQRLVVNATSTPTGTAFFATCNLGYPHNAPVQGNLT